jgi:hypothetical protein
MFKCLERLSRSHCRQCSSPVMCEALSDWSVSLSNLSGYAAQKMLPTFLQNRRWFFGEVFYERIPDKYFIIFGFMFLD